MEITLFANTTVGKSDCTQWCAGPDAHIGAVAQGRFTHRIRSDRHYRHYDAFDHCFHRLRIVSVQREATPVRGSVSVTTCGTEAQLYKVGAIATSARVTRRVCLFASSGTPLRVVGVALGLRERQVTPRLLRRRRVLRIGTPLRVVSLLVAQWNLQFDVRQSRLDLAPRIG